MSNDARQQLDAVRSEMSSLDFYVSFNMMQGNLRNLDREAHDALIKLCQVVKHLHAAVDALVAESEAKSKA